MIQPSALRHLTFTIALFFFVLPASVHAQNTPDRSEIFSNVENLIDDQQYDEALHLLESLINSDDPHIRAKALRIGGQIHLAEREINSAVDKLNRSLNLSRTIFNRTEEARSLYHLARAAIQSESFELAKQQAEEAAVIAKHLGDEMLTYRIQNFLTYIYYMTDTDFYKILDLETNVFHLVRRIGTPQQKAAAINNLGYDLTVAGTVPIDSTIALMNIANTLYAEMEGHNGRWYTLMNLTWQHRLKNNHEVSIKFGEMSLRQALTEEDRHAVIELSLIHI